MKNQIEQYFEKNREQLIASLQQLIAIPSVKGDASEGKPFGDGPAAALKYTLELARKLGLEVTNHENYVGTIDLTSELAPQLGILTHVDIVDIGANWTKDPLGGVIEDGKLYGRGATDDKGPTIASLFALAAIKELGVPLQASARLIVGTDEESGCADTKYYFKKESPPPFVFSPDGDFPVVNTEKGGLRTSFSAQFSEQINPIPAVVNIEAGLRVNVVPPEATCVVRGMRAAELKPYCEDVSGITGANITTSLLENNDVLIYVEGKGAHASTPELGINAITVLLMLLSKLPLAKSEVTHAIHGLANMFPFGDHDARAMGLAMEDEVSGKLTMNLAILKLDQNSLYGFIDSRTPICATVETTLGSFTKALAAYNIQVEQRGYSEAHHTPSDSPFVRTLLDAYELYSGNEGYCQAVGGGTYVHGIPGGVAFGCTMPGVDPNIHGADEFIIVEDLITSAKIFTQVIIDMCGKQDD